MSREYLKTRPDVAHLTDHIRLFIINENWYKMTTLARHCGFNRKTIQAYVNGYRSASIDSVECWLNALGYTLKPVPIGKAVSDE